MTDRGVDRLPVSESMPEEYCWLLDAVTGDFAFGEKAARDGVLHSLVDASRRAPMRRSCSRVRGTPAEKGCCSTISLDAHVILVRRALSAIEDSLGRAWDRLATCNRYVRALIGDRRSAAETLAAMLDPQARRRHVEGARLKMRADAVQLARSVGKLPLERVAFLSYDELCVDPSAGAAWAAHILDPAQLSEAFAAHTFPEYNKASGRGAKVATIDWYWARAWRRARARQVRAGILARPARSRPPAAEAARVTGG